MELNKPMSGEDRKKKYMEEKPSFFYDNSERDEAEILLDFYLSFTLRCAVEHPNINPLVREYARRVLFFLMQDEISYEMTDQVKIIDVRTWKQWERIDLVAEVEIEVAGELKYYAIIFENKLFTSAHHDQLNRYKICTENYYVKHPVKSNYKRLYLFVTCHDDIPEPDLEACIEADYRAISFQDIRYSIGSDTRTGDTLFDEFWFRYY